MFKLQYYIKDYDMRPDRHRLLLPALDGVKSRLGIVWRGGRTTVVDNGASPIVAEAVDAGVENVHADIRDWLFDKYGRSYVRGYSQGFGGMQPDKLRTLDLESDDYMEGYDDGIEALEVTGLVPNRPQYNRANLLAAAPPVSQLKRNNMNPHITLQLIPKELRSQKDIDDLVDVRRRRRQPVRP